MPAPVIKQVLPSQTTAVLVADCPDIVVSEESGPVIIQAEALESAKDIGIYWKAIDGTWEVLRTAAGTVQVLSQTMGTRYALTDIGTYRVDKPVTVAAASVSKVVKNAAY